MGIVFPTDNDASLVSQWSRKRWSVESDPEARKQGEQKWTPRSDGLKGLQGNPNRQSIIKTLTQNVGFRSSSLAVKALAVHARLGVEAAQDLGFHLS